MREERVKAPEKVKSDLLSKPSSACLHSLQKQYFTTLPLIAYLYNLGNKGYNLIPFIIITDFLWCHLFPVYCGVCGEVKTPGF